MAASSELVRRAVLAGGAAMMLGSSRRARAQANGPVRIAVLTDENGPYADISGPGSITAARMAAQEFGSVLGRPVEILHADTQNKADVSSIIARRWYDEMGVDAIVDMPLTSVAAAVQQIALQKSRIAAITGASSAELTSKSCSPVSTHWADDTMALSAGCASALIEAGRKSWYFITVDYSFGTALQENATAVLNAHGGKVVGSVRFPLGTTDYSSMIVRAQGSGSDVIALAAVGNDLVNLVKQLSEFGVSTSGKQAIGAFTLFINDVHALGLPIAGGLNLVSCFYWDSNDQTRRWATAFQSERKTMPVRTHALAYLATRHILRCMQASGTREAVAVNLAMRATPVDFFGRETKIRADGRLMSQLGLYRVKTPAESQAPWDYFKLIGTAAPEDAFAPANPACVT